MGFFQRLLSATVLALAALGGAAPPLARAEQDLGWRVRATTKDEAYAYSSLAFSGINGTDPRLKPWWASFKATYGKTYPSAAAERAAFANFVATLQQVVDVNLDKSVPWWASANAMADLTPAERAATFLMRTSPKPKPSPKPSPTPSDAARFAGAVEDFEEAVEELERTVRDLGCAGRRALRARATNAAANATKAKAPTGARAVDWRAAGKATPVKDQGGCGSCWAYAATAAIESAYLLATKQTYGATQPPLALSPQQLINCATGAYGSAGCDGGESDGALAFAHDHYLLTTKISPEHWEQRRCGMPASPPAHQAVRLASGPNVASPVTQAQLMALVDTQPVVFYFAVVDDWFSYAGGNYVATQACMVGVNHAMVLEGYVWTGQTQGSYWIVRNSWSADWGIAGRAYITMDDAIGGGREGPCFMQTFITYPPLAFSLTL